MRKRWNKMCISEVWLEGLILETGGLAKVWVRVQRPRHGVARR